MMKRISRILSYLSALLSALTLVRLRGRGMVLWGVKMLAGAWAPFLAVAGSLGALIGWARRDRKALWAGLFGAAVAVRYVVKVTEPGTDNGGFAQAFGPGWLSRIPPELQARMLPRRYTPLPPDPPQVRWQQDVVFGTHLETGDPLLCDIWQPPDGVPHTGMGVIYLHGSAWHYVDKDVGTRRFFRQLAGQGHVVMDVAYTLAPRAQLRAIVADVKRAIAWCKTHAAAYGADPERIVLVGGSSGGHLALLSAYTPNHPELEPADVDVDTSVRAVISCYGMPDLRTSYDYFRDFPSTLPSDETRLGRWCRDRMEAAFRRTRFFPPYGQLIDTPDCVPSLMGGTPDEVPELYHLGSPINHVGPHCPPTLLLQGAHDSGAMAPDVRRLHRALRQAGVPSVYVEFPDTEHAFDLIFPKWAPAAQAATYDTERFLALMV